MTEINDFSESLRISGETVVSFTGCPRSWVQRDIEKIKRWAEKSGRSWVTTRLKDLKAIALSFLADQDPNLPEYLGRKTRYKGKMIPALRMFSLLICCIENNNWKGIRSVLDLLNTYNVFRGPGDDVEEKISTITSLPSGTYDKEELANLRASLIRNFPFQKNTVEQRREFRGPDISGSRYAESPQRNSDCLSAMLPSITSVPAWIWSSVPKMKDWVMSHPFFGPIVTQYDNVLFSSGSKEPSPFWAGNLAVLGESGLKSRIVFVGNPWIQGILKSYVVPLQRYLLQLGTDCTFDQDKGREWLRERVSSGSSIVYSIDLSSATDRFPFFVQRTVGLLCGIPKFVLDIMEYAGFYNPLTRDTYGPVCKYAVGQGMGLYPSFALFALTHNCLLGALAKDLGLEPNDTFRILGDDVVISNKELASAYRKALKALQVPISERKSFSSTQFGEFGGRLFWRGHDVTPIKWRRVTLNSLDVISQYIERGMVDIDLQNQKIRFIPLASKSVIPHAEALIVLPKAMGGFGKLTRLPLSERLGWGRRRARSLRAGYLDRISERITAFLTGDSILRNVDVTKYRGMFHQSIKLTSLVERMKKFGGQAMMYGAPRTNDQDDIPKDREGLKDLESIAFGTDSLEERLGKYHAWFIAILGPNPVREFNRMITQSGQPIDITAVPVVGSASEVKRLQRLRHLPPSSCPELFGQAEERVKELQGIKEFLRAQKSGNQKSGLPVGRFLATAAATVVNPALGLAVGAASILSLLGEEGDDSIKPKNLDRLYPG